MATTGPVFIVGMNGSGTTMLLDHLDSHPKLFGFPYETKILPYYLSSTRWTANLHDDERFLGLIREIAGAYPFVAANMGQPVPLPDAWNALPRTPAAAFDAVMRYFAAREGKSRWCEKSPMHVQHISTLATVFPDAQFIHVIRDGRDCAASFHRRWGYTPSSTIYRWKRCVNEGRAQGRALGPSRYIEVFYERLTATPVPELKAVCDFLDVEFDSAVLHAHRDTTRVHGLSDRAIVENRGSHAVYFRPADRVALENIAGATLGSLGYRTDMPTGDYDPPGLQRLAWRIIDRLRVANRIISRKAKAPKPFPWRIMQSKFRRAIRQFRSDRF